jgi:hypothetical protein
MMSERQFSNGKCCTDCLVLLANGDTPSEMSEPEVTEYLAGMDDTEVTLGRMFGEEDCEHTADDSDYEDHAENCEQLGFSWSPCDVCRRPLGGERYAVTFWL